MVCWTHECMSCSVRREKENFFQEVRENWGPGPLQWLCGFDLWNFHQTTNTTEQTCLRLLRSAYWIAVNSQYWQGQIPALYGFVSLCVLSSGGVTNHTTGYCFGLLSTSPCHNSLLSHEKKPHNNYRRERIFLLPPFLWYLGRLFQFLKQPPWQ